MARPSRHVARATAPVRVCDLGGWTDTWFAGHGAVTSIAVSPRTQATATLTAGVGPRVALDVADFGARYEYDGPDAAPGRHPLLEQAVAAAGVPEGWGLEVRLAGGVPPGASMGTSASVCVALLAAIDAVAAAAGARPRRAALDLARLAHRVETERLGLQAGVQDQVAAAVGGANLIEITEYPHVDVRRLAVGPGVADALRRRLVVVFLGRGHVSSAVHERVIAALAGEGPSSPRLERLRQCARDGAAALERGDLDGFGRVMRENTDAQAALAPELVARDAEAVIAIARAVGAVGWKVNGAGGEGGTVTVLCGADAAAREAFSEGIAATGAFTMLPAAFSTEGVAVNGWEEQ